MSEPAETSDLTRRACVAGLGAGLGVLSLPRFGGNTALAAESVAGPSPHFAPRAKRVIHLFMNGGPFQGDLLDPKPGLAKYAGQRPKEVDLRTERKTAGLLPSPFKFQRRGESGVPVSELLPQFGGVIDDVCVLRSVHTDNPNHGPALLLMNNGSITPTVPSMGSWFLYGLGSENESLPGYVVLCPGRPVRFSILWSSAFLPAKYQGTYINHSQLDPRKMIPFLQNGTLSTPDQRRQLDLVRALNQKHLSQRPGDSLLEARLQALETAFRMQSEAEDAFDVNREPASIRKQYGEGHFADGCLLARRLVERGVRFVQLYYGNGQPWDTHDKHSERVRNLAGTVDQPMAALLTDLKQRGMLEDTLVIWGGEFGRTPTSENGNGRDHNHYGFSMWMAGGGIRGGMTYGETDDFGFRAVVDRVHIHDLHATVLHLLGIDHNRLTFRHAGRDFRLTDVHGRVIQRVLD